MATNKLQWRRIAKGDKLPCQSFLRKKDGEILKLSTGAGIKVGQDAYYLPVDDVIEEIKNYPIEESKDEMICRKLITFLKQCKAVYCDGFKQFGLDIDDVIAWLEKQGEQKSTWSKEDEQLYNDLSDTYFYNDEDYPEETYKLMLKRVLDWMNKRAKFLRPQSTWKPSEGQMELLREVQQALLGKDCHNRFVDFMYELKRLREE